MLHTVNGLPFNLHMQCRHACTQELLHMVWLAFDYRPRGSLHPCWALSIVLSCSSILSNGRIALKAEEKSLH